jgi:glycosyltransferase involved in cell wall biosynthesis
MRRLFTGVDETLFSLNLAPQKREVFTVLFRGYANPEAGLAHIVSVARALESEGIHFLVISPNARLKDLPKNVEYREGFFDRVELCEWMQSCHASIGHVSTNERLERTIPHKAFEAMLLKLPFVMADVAAIREILDEGSSVLVRPGDEGDIAAQLRKLRDDSDLRDRIAEMAYSTYQKRCANAVLSGELIEHIRMMLD